MQLYSHYKNKPYKYLGTAKHSETLEDLVLYETRYPNDLSRLWVRPQKMFFESIQLNGQDTPRFRKIPLNIQSFTTVGEKEIQTITPLMKTIFGQWDSQRFYLSFKKKKKFHLLLATIDDKCVGFKLGYEKDNHTFYSWLGGILTEYRGVGIANDLMDVQHTWCREQGYKVIQTKTQNQYRGMLTLNIKAGFNIIATEVDPNGDGLKIVMEKKL